MSVILNAPAVFRLTTASSPPRHRQAAKALGANVSGVPDDQVGEVLAQRIIEFMRQLNMPNGLSAVGYSEKDIPKLVEGTIPQHRVTKLSPHPVDETVLSQLFQDALAYW
jgi:hydroxyacid-oxoacid transhydrogenase